MFYSEDDVKAALTQHLKREVNDEAWKILLMFGVVQDVSVGEADIGNLAKEYREVLSINAGGTPKVQAEPRVSEREIGPDERLEILASILAKDAEQDSEVQSFRRDRMNGVLIGHDEVREWIEKRSASDGPITVYVSYPVPADHVQGNNIEVSNLEGVKPTGRSTQLIDYFAPVNDGVRSLPIARDGVLGELRQVGEKLSKRYEWTSSQSTVFVLTGTPPSLSRARIRINHGMGFNWKNRIVIDVDPTVSPKDLMELYRKARADLGQSYYRPMESKHLRLGEFYGGARSVTWSKLMKKWNDANPNESYKNASIFGRDCRHAWKRIVGKMEN